MEETANKKFDYALTAVGGNEKKKKKKKKETSYRRCRSHVGCWQLGSFRTIARMFSQDPGCFPPIDPTDCSQRTHLALQRKFSSVTAVVLTWATVIPAEYLENWN